MSKRRPEPTRRVRTNQNLFSTYTHDATLLHLAQKDMSNRYGEDKLSSRLLALHCSNGAWTQIVATWVGNETYGSIVITAGFTTISSKYTHTKPQATWVVANALSRAVSVGRHVTVNIFIRHGSNLGGIGSGSEYVWGGIITNNLVVQGSWKVLKYWNTSSCNEFYHSVFKSR